jgi:quinoprotein glucose dehydrogenase
MSKSKWRQNIEVNPVFLNGKLIYVTPDWKIICLDIEKKKVLWELQTIFPPSRRGILAYKKDNKEYLVLPVGGKIYKIDLITGKRIKTFGNNGSVKATTITSPIVDLETKNLIIVNHNKKFVHILDIQSGKTKKIIPLFERRKWSGGSPWAGIAYDDINKLLYVPTGNPHPSLYGVKRPGNNLGSSSLIAIDIKNYKIIWTFQEVFHDLWDYDLAFPPFIDDILIDNNLYNIVSLVAKTGNNILLERFTGKPIFNIDFQKTTPSIVDGEITSNYQIKIETPEKLSKIEYNNESFSELVN